MAGRAPWETIRRFRLGDYKTVLRHRYGYELPDDDAGRGDLADLLALNEPKNWINAIELWAPWMPEGEAAVLMDALASFQPDMSPKALGVRLGLTHAEHERLAIRQITPCDITAEEFAAAKRARRRAKRTERRRKKGVCSRREYEASSASRLKPWEAAGVSRATWYRRKAQ